MNTKSISVRVLLIAICLAPVGALAWESDYTTGHLTYTSTSQVMTLNGAVGSIRPAIDDAKVPAGDAADYLSSSSCLGHYGPVSAYGPLGTLGPVGDNTWNPSYWISAWGDWSAWSSTSFGVLGQDGPLGEAGPVSDEQYYGTADPGMTLFDTNDFAVHTRALGAWTVLGPIGPLGALGPLGPLGPNGAHGYDDNSDGEYLDGGSVVRTIDVQFDAGTQRTYELFEFYRSEDFARQMADNDTSFMVRGVCNSYREVDTYTFTSAYDQIVTILIVPEKEFDDFDLAIALDGDTQPSIVSNTGYATMDWVQLKAPAGTSMTVSVSLYWTGHWLSSSYRLIVVGSGPDLNQTEITGNHIATWK